MLRQWASEGDCLYYTLPNLVHRRRVYVDRYCGLGYFGVEGRRVSRRGEGKKRKKEGRKEKNMVRA